MSIADLLGRVARLKILRFAAPGAYLGADGADDRDAILLIGSETPPDAKAGDEIDVFVHLDSAGRLIASTRVAKLELGQVAFLEVTDRTTVGAFVDWGLAKELLVPFAEQTVDMRVRERYAVGLYIDNSGRLAGTMRVSQMVMAADARPEWQLDEWVEGEAWRNDPAIGLFVIVEKQFVALVPKSEPHTLSRGAAARFRVSQVLADGKIELSLRGHAHEELDSDAERIFDVLRRANSPRVGDKSSPDQIRALFGLSKKAFKRGAGRLLKEGKISLDEDGLWQVLR